MQQITLTEYTESYAVSIDHALPENGPIFFKDKYGNTFKGEAWNNGKDFFVESGVVDFEIEEIESFHPVTVDL